jgi:hypothetical protein
VLRQLTPALQGGIQRLPVIRGGSSLIAHLFHFSPELKIEKCRRREPIN